MTAIRTATSLFFEIINDFRVTGVSLRDISRSYSQAFITVGVDLWREFSPNFPATFPDLKLPSLPDTWSAELKSQADSEELTWQLVAIGVIIFIVGTVWFLFMMIFVAG